MRIIHKQREYNFQRIKQIFKQKIYVKKKMKYKL